MKACPVCFEQIENQEGKCRWCGEKIAADAPASDTVSLLKRALEGASGNPRVLAAVLAVAVVAIVGAVGVRGDTPRGSEKNASGGGQQSPEEARCSILLGFLFAPVASTDSATQAQGMYDAAGFLQQYFPADTATFRAVLGALEEVRSTAADERTDEMFTQIRHLCDRSDIVSEIDTYARN